MKTAIVHFSGLHTDPAGDCCGMRPFWEAIAELIGAVFIVIAYNDPKAREKFTEIVGTYDVVYVSGHSHGAELLYELLRRIATINVLVAAFLDLAPEWNPGAWMGPDWPAPAISLLGLSLCFYQRNDVPLAGVKIDADEVFDVSDWGLHHSTMCADERVHVRIKDAVLTRHVIALRQFYSPAPPAKGAQSNQ